MLLYFFANSYKPVALLKFATINTTTFVLRSWRVSFTDYFTQKQFETFFDDPVFNLFKIKNHRIKLQKKKNKTFT